MNNLTVAVWGNIGSGVTTFSSTLANELTDYFSRVLLISADKYSPAFASWGIETDENDGTMSIADICVLNDITKDTIGTHSKPCQKNTKLNLLGYLSTDDCSLNESITGNAAQSLLSASKEVAQITVVDCSIPQHDSISDRALKTADVVIILLEPNPKGIGFVYSQRAYIEDNLTDDREYIYIPSKVMQVSSVDEFERRLGLSLFKERLPLTFETEVKLTQGDLFSKYSGEYGTTVTNVARKIMEGVRNDKDNVTG